MIHTRTCSAGGALCTLQGPGRTPRCTRTVMSAAFHPDSTRQNHPDWVVDPVVDWERTTERRKQRKFLKHWSTRGSGSVDRATPEPFTWVKERQKKHPNVTTQKINQSRFEDSIARENAKISHKIKRYGILWGNHKKQDIFGCKTIKLSFLHHGLSIQVQERLIIRLSGVWQERIWIIVIWMLLK